ncbi:MAG TPA: hypothetical protein VKY59_02870 [Spirillospora sp.]|nr:hypothetical protein [Spirillospora sp.]
MRNLAIIVLLIAAFGAAVMAQDADESVEREIITVLKMGDEVFEPEMWLASAGETTSYTTATFQPRREAGFSAVSFINYLHFDTGYTLDGLDDFFNDTWFEQAFAGWEELRKTNVCFNGDVTLHEFTLAYRESNGGLARYVMRYWVDPISETRVRAWHIAFATTFADGTTDARGRELLDEYSARMYPDFPACSR